MEGKYQVTESSELVRYSKVKRVVFLILERKNKMQERAWKSFGLKLPFAPSTRAKQISTELQTFNLKHVKCFEVRSLKLAHYTNVTVCVLTLPVI